MRYSRPWMAFALGMIVLLSGQALGVESKPAVADDAMVQTYRKALDVDPADVLAQFNLGLALYRMERFDEAKEALVRALNLNQKDERTHAQIDGPANQILGIIYFNYLKDNQKAIDYFEHSLTLQGKEAETSYALGMAYFRQKAYARALAAFDQAAQSGHVPDAEWHYQKGLALTELGREEDAIKTFQEALKRKPDFSAVLENLALIHHRQNRDDETIAVLTRLIKIEPMNFNANYMLGIHYYRKKMYTEMVAAYNRAVAVKPDLAEAHYNLGMAYYYQTRYELAVEELKKTVALNPKDVDAYNLLGQAQTAAVESYLHQGGTYLAQENYSDALAVLQKVFVVDPGNLKAKELLEEADRRVREEYAAHMRLGDKFANENKLEDAYNEYELATRLKPTSPEALEGKRKTGQQLGQLLGQRMQKAKMAEQQKDYREAYAQYGSVLELRPNYPQAKKALSALRQFLRSEIQRQFKLAEQYAGKEQLNEAAAEFKRILKIVEVTRDETEQERALAGLTRVNAARAELIAQYLTQGRKLAGVNDAKAKELFNRVLKLEPQNKVANEYILRLTGVQSQAKVTDEQIKITYYSGVNYYVNGKIEEAIQEWEKVVVLDPDNQDAKINITRARAKLAAIRKLTQGN